MVVFILHFQSTKYHLSTVVRPMLPSLRICPSVCYSRLEHFVSTHFANLTLGISTPRQKRSARKNVTGYVKAIEIMIVMA